MKARAGFTHIEAMISLAILSFVITGAAMMSTSAGRSFDRTAAQLDADRGASGSVQRMMLDLEEAKQVTVVSTTFLRVFFPQVAADGTYIRSALDNVNYIEYYRGTSAGTANTTGDCLVRKPAGGTARVITSGVANVQFASTNPSSVDITLQTLRPSFVGNARCDMLHRAIFLRNY
jgi:type II secretory pathway pseudopilin PulG